MGTNDHYFQASYTTAYVIERLIFQQKIPFRHDVEQVALDVKYVQQMLSVISVSPKTLSE